MLLRTIETFLRDHAMPATLEAESTLTDRYQTTVPETVRRALRLGKRDKMRYTIRPSITLNFGVQNLFNEPQIYYRSIRDQLETFLVNGTTITAGVEGRF
jgi:bifunctional DNA-binding transcriptional regulator/antitoxin component of YhaV-PrlF toxin-antitoxin module